MMDTTLSTNNIRYVSDIVRRRKLGGARCGLRMSAKLYKWPKDERKQWQKENSTPFYFLTIQQIYNSTMLDIGESSWNDDNEWVILI